MHNVEQTPAVAPATVDAGIIRREGSPGFGAKKVFTVSYAKSWTPEGKPPMTTSHKNLHQHGNPNKSCILEKVGTPCEKIAAYLNCFTRSDSNYIDTIASEETLPSLCFHDIMENPHH